MKNPALRITGIALSAVMLAVCCGGDAIDAVYVSDVCDVCYASKFADDQVVVVYKHSECTVNQIRTLDDFSELALDSSTEIEKIEDLTYISGDVENNKLINREQFCQIICLTLKNRGEANVLRAIEILEKRNDLEHVGPNYHGHISFL